MRFLFQDAGAKLATKCIRVSSTANTEDVIETLVEKFRPDMKMLTTPIYHLYEVDSNGCKFSILPIIDHEINFFKMILWVLAYLWVNTFYGHWRIYG